MKIEDILLLRKGSSLHNVNVLLQLLKTIQSRNMNLNVSDLLPIKKSFLSTREHIRRKYYCNIHVGI